MIKKLWTTFLIMWLGFMLAVGFASISRAVAIEQAIVSIRYAPPYAQYEAVSWDLKMDGVLVCNYETTAAEAICANFEAAPGERSFTVIANRRIGTPSPESPPFIYFIDPEDQTQPSILEIEFIVNGQPIIFRGVVPAVPTP